MTGRYRVEVARRAAKVLTALPLRDRQRIRAAIELLSEEPRPPGCTKLVGRESAFRVRTGDYRILYEVHDRRLVVQVVRLGHRRDVYRE